MSLLKNKLADDVCIFYLNKFLNLPFQNAKMMQLEKLLVQLMGFYTK